MLGWEYPPFISGGLGTACHGLTQAMSRLKVDVLFVLPNAVGGSEGGEAAATPSQAAKTAVPSHYPGCGAPQWPTSGGHAQAGEGTGGSIRGERPSQQATVHVVGAGAMGGYDGNLIDRIRQYADRCVQMTRHERFDVIHAHDWVTFPAGLAVAAEADKPLIVHVHSTEFDRSGEQVHGGVYDIERHGIQAATGIIAVSHFTSRILSERYGVASAKVRVVHNGVDRNTSSRAPRPGGNGQRVVLFLGRITMQKGPEFFVAAAARLLQKVSNVSFVMAGWGDLAPRMIEQVAAMGLGRHVRFTGFLHGQDVERAYRMADVYVMPSVSEPFGLTALEAVKFGVPAIVSKNSGVAEVLLKGALKVDFWDIDEMANKIAAILSRPHLAKEMRRHGQAEISALTWDAAARKCMTAYREGIEAYESSNASAERTARAVLQ